MTTSLNHSRILPIDTRQLLAQLAANDEIALIDVREAGVQARDGYIIHSVPLPLSQLELNVDALLPRKTVNLVVIDADDGSLAHRAALKLIELGFSHVSVLQGGVAAWRKAGLEVYTGESAYSKAFGELVEHRYGTPHISARELQQRLDRQDDLLLLDGRTIQEFENFSIPGAHAVPNAELPYRVHGLLRSPDTLVVVNCAGRTRSIIGAQSLINAGLVNPVAALENGTMDWLAEGLVLQTGRLQEALPPEGAAREKAKQSVRTLTERFGIRWIDGEQLQSLRDERAHHSLYILDVRTQAEFNAGHLPDARWAEGGQLVQGIDKYVGVRNSRIVVVDDELGVRAAITASWLQQLGWAQVFAHATHQTGEDRNRGSAAALQALALPKAETISVNDLANALERDAVVLLDLAPSTMYEAGHIPGAIFAIRAKLDTAQLRPLLETGKSLVVTSPDGVLARLAVAEIAALVFASVRALDGGTAAWLAAQHPLRDGAAVLLHTPDDVWRSPYQAPDRLKAFREYLEWEVNLLDQIKRDETVHFGIPA